MNYNNEGKFATVSRFCQERHVIHERSLRLARHMVSHGNAIQALDLGVHNRIQITPGIGVGENNRTQRTAVKFARGQQNVWTKTSLDRPEARRACGDCLTSESIGVDNFGSELAQDPRYRGLSRCHTACQSNDRHILTLSRLK
jgi:hypothetical protein